MDGALIIIVSSLTDNGWNHPRGDKKGRPKKGQKMHKPVGTKKKRGRELLWEEAISPTAPLMSPTCKS
jgi:hypothetical protein